MTKIASDFFDKSQRDMKIASDRATRTNTIDVELAELNFEFFHIVTLPPENKAQSCLSLKLMRNWPEFIRKRSTRNLIIEYQVY